jgi:Flp pilus assembly protein TadG
MRRVLTLCISLVVRLGNGSRPIGAALVEFGLLLPILLITVFGAINLGALMYDQSVVTNAAREGARWASIRATETNGSSCTNAYSLQPVDPCQVAYSYAANRLISFNNVRSPTVSYSASNGYASGTPQAVTVSYSFKGIGWFFGSRDLSTYSATSVMIHE